MCPTTLSHSTLAYVITEYGHLPRARRSRCIGLHSVPNRALSVIRPNLRQVSHEIDRRERTLPRATIHRERLKVLFPQRSCCRQSATGDRRASSPRTASRINRRRSRGALWRRSRRPPAIPDTRRGPSSELPGGRELAAAVSSRRKRRGEGGRARRR